MNPGAGSREPKHNRPPAEARGPTKEQREPHVRRSNSSWSSDEDYVDPVLSNDLSNVANAIGDDANPADGQYLPEVQIHLSEMTDKIEHVDDLLPNLVQIDGYARLLPETLAHLQTQKLREILPWLITQRNRIVALITPEAGKNAAEIFGLSKSQVLKYVRSVEKPTAQKVQERREPWGVYTPDLEAALATALAKMQDPPTQRDKQNLRAVMPQALRQPKVPRPKGAPKCRSSKFPPSEQKSTRKKIKQQMQNVRQRVICANGICPIGTEYITLEQLKDEFKQARQAAKRSWDQNCFGLEEKYSRSAF